MAGLNQSATPRLEFDAVSRNGLAEGPVAERIRTTRASVGILVQVQLALHFFEPREHSTGPLPPWTILVALSAALN